MRFPQISDETNLFYTLSNYINEFNKEWIKKIKPASNTSIELLKRVSEIQKWREEFPKPYYMFLETMGENDGGLLSDSLIGTAHIIEIIDLYEEFHKFSPEVFDTPYLSFFQMEMGGELSFDLSGKHAKNILETDSGELFRINSESFEKLLFQSAFNCFERFGHYIGFSSSLSQLKKATSIHEKKDLFETIDIIAKSYGLEKAWFSDEKHYIAIGLNTSFCVQKAEGTIGFVTSSNKALLKELVWDLTKLVGASLPFESQKYITK